MKAVAAVGGVRGMLRSSIFSLRRASSQAKVAQAKGTKGCADRPVPLDDSHITYGKGKPGSPTASEADMKFPRQASESADKHPDKDMLRRASIDTGIDGSMPRGSKRSSSKRATISQADLARIGAESPSSPAGQSQRARSLSKISARSKGSKEKNRLSAILANAAAEGLDVLLWPGSCSTDESQEYSMELLRFALARKMSKQYRLSQEKVTSIFDHLDRAAGGKSGGLLDLNGFRSALRGIANHKDINEKGVLKAWSLMTEACSTKREGIRELNLEALVEWYANEDSWSTLKNSLTWIATKEAMTELAEELSIVEDKLQTMKKVFDRADKSKSGIMDYTEFRDMMQEKSGLDLIECCSDSDMTLWWQAVDSDDSGMVEFPEFAMWYLEFFDLSTGKLKTHLEKEALQCSVAGFKEVSLARRKSNPDLGAQEAPASPATRNGFRRPAGLARSQSNANVKAVLARKTSNPDVGAQAALARKYSNPDVAQAMVLGG